MSVQTIREGKSCCGTRKSSTTGSAQGSAATHLRSRTSPVELSRSASWRAPVQSGRKSGVQIDTDGRMLLSAFTCGDGTVDFAGLVTARGKVYAAALARSRVEDISVRLRIQKLL